MINKIDSTNRFKNKKNRHLLTLQSNTGLHYFTSSFRYFDERTKFHFIKLIDDYIQENINNNKYGIDDVHKNSKIKALKKLKKLMLMNKGDKKIYGQELKFPSNEHYKDFKIIEKSIKDFPKKKEFFFEKYIKRIDKDIIKKKPQSPQVSTIFTNKNYYTNTQSTNTYYNTQMFNPIHTEKITRPNTYSELITYANSNNNLETNKKENEINIYQNTKTSFFSLALSNARTMNSGNSNDDLSFSNLIYF